MRFFFSAGMRQFMLLWLGQNTSLVGSQLTGFALGVWLYQRTGSATLYGLMVLANIAPMVITSPLAGVLVDRWDRRRALLVGQCGAFAFSLLLCVLFAMGMADVWVVLSCVALSSCFIALLFPGFSAAMSTMVPANQLGRANGMVQLGFALSQIAAPATAGALLQATGMVSILVLDIVSFVIAIGVLLCVRIPAQAKATSQSSRRSPFFEEIKGGYAYIRQRRGLLTMLLLFAAVMLSLGMVQVVGTPLVLGFATSADLGLVLSIGGGGMVVGSALMLAWGGPKRQIDGVLGGMFLQGVLLASVGLLKPSVLLIAIAAFGEYLALPLVLGCSQTIWQRKVPFHLQGRVFALREMVLGGATCIACLLAGPLCDRLFEPLMAEQGALAESLGRIIGTGPGRGAALFFSVLGAITIAIALAGYFYPRLRRVEDELPDCHDPARSTLTAAEEPPLIANERAYRRAP